jgi:hypothetical protein
MALPAATTKVYGSIKLIRWLIWIYFFLLIFEGFLRMVLPMFADALLVARDPFLLIMYLVAHVSRVFPWNRFVIMLWILGFIALAFGLSTNPNLPIISLYGFRVAFLHVPLIFLIANVMEEKDILDIGRWFLILSIPIAILMAIQFRMGPDHWLNRGIDMQFRQIESAGGKIRPPGTFTFTLGPSIFFAFVVSFIMYDQFHKVYSKTLIILATSATCLGLAVSGSRYALASSGTVVLLAVVAVLLAKPKAVSSFVKFAFVVAIGLIIMSQFSIFGEGVDVFSQRITAAGVAEGGFEGFLMRAFGEYIVAIGKVSHADIMGAGLGFGTNAGAALMTSQRGFTLAEGEWARVILEMGPYVGLVFLSMRLGLVVWLGLKCFNAAKMGKMLPIMLFGSCATVILSGQWGQTTVLGFAALGGGLCVAALPRKRPAKEWGQD